MAIDEVLAERVRGCAQREEAIAQVATARP